MRIKRLLIDGFGCLTNRKVEFPESGLALIVADNERGKTTLAEALLAGLGGLPTRPGRADKSDPKRRYRPWDAAIPYSLELDLYAGGRDYRVRRDFSSRDGFSIRHSDSLLEISAESDKDLCAQFLRLSGDDYRRVALISGKEHSRLSESRSLQDCLAAVVEGSGRETGVTAAVALLNNAKIAYADKPPRLPKTAVSELESETRAKNDALAGVMARMDQAQHQWAELTALHDQASVLKQRQELLETEYAAARLREITSRIEEAEKAALDLASLEEERKLLEPFANFPAERKVNLLRASTRLDENQKRAGESRARLEGLDSEARVIQDWLEHRTRFDGKTAEDAERLRSALTRVADCRANLESKQAEIDQENKTCGQDISEIARLEGLYAKLPAREEEFLSTFEKSRIEFERDVLSSEAQLEKADRQTAEILEARTRGKRMGIAVAGVGMLAVALSPLLSLPGAAMIALFAIAALFVLGGVACFARSSGHEADRLATLKHTRGQCTASIAERENSRQTAEQKLSDIALGLGLPGPQAVLESYQKLKAGSAGLARIRGLLAQRQQLADQHKAAIDEGVFLCGRYGDMPEPGQLERALWELNAGLNDYLARLAKLSSVRENQAAQSRQLQGTQTSIEADSLAVREVLSEAGLDPDLPRETWLKAFEDREQQYNRYRDLTSRLIPSARGRLVSPNELESRKNEARELQQSLDGHFDRREKSPEIPPCGRNDMPCRELPDIEKDRRSVGEEVATVSDRILTLEREMAGGISAYRQSFPQIRDELAECNRLLRVARRFGEAVALASEALNAVSETTREKWATALNQRASAVLPSLNPDYKTISFDDSLRMRLERASDGRIIEPDEIDTALSTGARDQVLLAARIAIADELSAPRLRSGTVTPEEMPLILDDPFIATDDRRFISGMRYLAEEVSSRTQAIVLTCHASRHSVLEAQRWFAENVSILRL